MSHVEKLIVGGRDALGRRRPTALADGLLVIMKLFRLCHALVLWQCIVAFVLLGWRLALLVHHRVVYKSLLVHADVDVNIDVQVEMV